MSELAFDQDDLRKTKVAMDIVQGIFSVIIATIAKGKNAS